jgi:tight adherence protein C
MSRSDVIPIPLTLALVTFACALAVGYVVVRVQRHRRTVESVTLILGSYAVVDPLTSPQTHTGRPGHLLASLGRRLTTAEQRQHLQTHLDYAGRPDTTALEAALRTKVVLAVTGALVGAVFGALAGGWFWCAVPLLLVGAFWLPDLLIYNAGLRRTALTQRELPDAIELLGLCVQSGMGFQAALAQVATFQDGPVAQEFARVLREMQLGQSRQTALESLGRRSKQEDLTRFVTAVVQADRLGIAISGILTEQAAEMRSKRRDRARERAQKVPVKILLPVILCFLPGIFIIVLGPAAISLVQLFSNFGE